MTRAFDVAGIWLCVIARSASDEGNPALLDRFASARDDGCTLFDMRKQMDGTVRDICRQPRGNLFYLHSANHRPALCRGWNVRRVHVAF